MMKSTPPYFVLDGNAAEALKFYSTILDETIQEITYFKDTPEDAGFKGIEDIKDLVINTSIKLPNGYIFMFSDSMPGAPFVKGDQLTAALVFDNLEDTRRIFDLLKEGGSIIMELGETFCS